MRICRSRRGSVGPAMSGVLLALSVGLYAEEVERVRTAEAKAVEALEHLAGDLAGTLPSESGAQALCLFDVGADNGRSVADGEYGARDAMMFWAVTRYRDEVSGAHITYMVDAGDDSEEAGPRRMVLRRIVRRRQGEGWEDPPLLMDLCQNVTSCNIEVLYDADGPAKPALPSFVQLNDKAAGPYATAFDWWGTFPHPASPDQVPPGHPMAAPYCAGRIAETAYPIGVAIDPPGAWQWPPIPEAIRVTLRVIVDNDVPRERLLSRVIWIPSQ